MVQITSWMHSTFKDLSNEYSHAQIRVKMKKLWPRQVGEEKQVAVRKVCRDQEVCRDQCSDQAVCRDQCHDQASCRDQCRYQKALSRPETLRNLKKRPKINILT